MTEDNTLEILKIKLAFYEDKFELMKNIVKSYRIEVDGLSEMLISKDAKIDKMRRELSETKYAHDYNKGD